MRTLRPSLSVRLQIPLVALALASGAWAAEEKLPPEVLKLQMFLGNWKGRLEMKEVDKPPQVLSFALQCQKAAGGSAVSCTAREKNKELDIQEANLFGYEPNEQLVHFFAVTNQGETHDHKGRWTDEKTLALEYTGTLEAKPFSEKLSIVFSAKNAFTAEFVGSIEGKEIYRGQIQAKK